MVMASIYLIDDDARLCAMVTGRLEERGHHVRSSGQGLVGLKEILDDRPDVVILDLGLPDIDGVEVLRVLRSSSSVPVVVATARGSEREVIALLDAGADDYLVKPYSTNEMEARLRAVLRRASAQTTDGRVTVGPLTIDVAGRVARLDDEALDLSRKEFDLLVHLASHQGEVVTKRELLADVWRQPFGGSEKTVDVHLSWLRKKLGESAENSRFLHTIRGVGVKMIDPTCAEN